MLTSGATENSTTQNELLDALGRFRNIQGLQDHYEGLLKEYRVSIGIGRRYEGERGEEGKRGEIEGGEPLSE